MIACDHDDDDIFLYTVNSSYPSTLKLTQERSIRNRVYDIAIAQNNLWVASNEYIYQFDGGTLTFFQDVGYCYNVEFSAEGDFFFCSDPYDDELRIYKNNFTKEEGFPTWAIVVTVIASVCLCSIFIALGVFYYRKQRQERYGEQESEEGEGDEMQRRQGQKEERRFKSLRLMDSDRNFLGRPRNA